MKPCLPCPDQCFIAAFFSQWLCARKSRQLVVSRAPRSRRTMSLPKVSLPLVSKSLIRDRFADSRKALTLPVKRANNYLCKYYLCV